MVLSQFSPENLLMAKIAVSVKTEAALRMEEGRAGSGIRPVTPPFLYEVSKYYL